MDRGSFGVNVSVPHETEVIYFKQNNKLFKNDPDTDRRMEEAGILTNEKKKLIMSLLKKLDGPVKCFVTAEEAKKVDGIMATCSKAGTEEPATDENLDVLSRILCSAEERSSQRKNEVTSLRNFLQEMLNSTKVPCDQAPDSKQLAFSVLYRTTISWLNGQTDRYLPESNAEEIEMRTREIRQMKKDLENIVGWMNAIKQTPKIEPMSQCNKEVQVSPHQFEIKEYLENTSSQLANELHELVTRDEIAELDNVKNSLLLLLDSGADPLTCQMIADKYREKFDAIQIRRTQLGEEMREYERSMTPEMEETCQPLTTANIESLLDISGPPSYTTSCSQPLSEDESTTEFESIIRKIPSSSNEFRNMLLCSSDPFIRAQDSYESVYLKSCAANNDRGMLSTEEQQKNAKDYRNSIRSHISDVNGLLCQFYDEMNQLLVTVNKLAQRSENTPLRGFQRKVLEKMIMLVGKYGEDYLGCLLAMDGCLVSILDGHTCSVEYTTCVQEQMHTHADKANSMRDQLRRNLKDCENCLRSSLDQASPASLPGLRFIR